MQRRLASPVFCSIRKPLLPVWFTGKFYSVMADKGQPASAEKAGAKNDGKKELRILMLHGYTQSGNLFRAKTRALEKILVKALAPANIVPNLIYPTGPNRLFARDVPGYVPDGDGEDADADEQSDSWAWFRKDEATGSYRLLNEGMQRLAEVMRDTVKPSSSLADPSPADGVGWGGIDGVIGFSQGGSMAAMLAAAMEILPSTGSTREAPKQQEDSTSPSVGGYDWSWVQAVREANRGVPLKFAVVYSGFFAPPAELAWLYEPRISTPTLQFIGSLDTVVDEGRSRGLVDRCDDPVVVVHPGGHYVPVSKEWTMPLVGFIRERVAS